MSQAKVDRYKQEKANRKKTLAKQKVVRLVARACAWVVAIGLLGWAGYSGYSYYEATRPSKTFFCQTTELDEYLEGISY